MRMLTTRQNLLTDTCQTHRRRAVRSLTLLAAAGVNVAHAPPASRKESRILKIRIVVGQDSAVAELDDNPTSRDFVALLPMSVTLEDFAGREKIKRLSTRLSTSDSPSGQPASVWDIAYYVPWGNIAIFYKPYDPSPELIKMGRVASGQDVLTKASSFAARIDLPK
jgi:hypothetical protein